MTAGAWDINVRHQEREGTEMSFCTAVNCMDGRVQQPVADYMKRKLGIEYVDMITEQGPNLILAEQDSEELVASIMARIDTSVNHHGSNCIAVVGHYDCAGNQANQLMQSQHTRRAVRFLKRNYKYVQVIGLWVDENWRVEEVTS